MDNIEITESVLEIDSNRYHIWDYPLSHFIKMLKKYGYKAVKRGLQAVMNSKSSPKSTSYAKKMKILAAKWAAKNGMISQEDAQEDIQKTLKPSKKKQIPMPIPSQEIYQQSIPIDKESNQKQVKTNDIPKIQPSEKKIFIPERL